MPSVTIIGGGIAGVAAAYWLSKNGICDVTLLEASDRLGGRIHTASFGEGIVELGANWIHGGCLENPLYVLANQFQLWPQPPPSRMTRLHDLWYTSNGRAVEKALGEKAQQVFFEVENEAIQLFHLQKKRKPQSMEDYYNTRLEERLVDFADHERDTVKQIFSGCKNLTRFHGGDDLDLMNVSLYGQYRDIPGGDCPFQKGLQSLIHVLTAFIPNNVIKFGRNVTKVTWNDKIQISCENGETYSSDYLIISISLGCLKNLHDTLFEPPLPEKKLIAINNLGFGRVDKIFLEFDYPFWGMGEGGMKLALIEKEAVPKKWWEYIFAFDQVYHNPRVLVAWISGLGAVHMETLSDEEVLEKCVMLLRKYSGNPTLPIPVKILRSNWISNPYTRGSYSYPNLTSEPKHVAWLSEPLANERFLWAGEATHPYYYSTMHGAYLSGIREAQRIKDHTTKSSRH